MRFNVLSFAFLNLLSLVAAENGDYDHRYAISNSSACEMKNSPSGSGFDAIFYEYPLFVGYDENFIKHGYRSNKEVASTTGVTDINFYNNPGNTKAHKGKIYGQEIYVSNFSLQLTGYFYADQSGYYEVIFTGTDDGLVMYMGEGAFSCCNSSYIDTSDLNNEVIYTTGSIGNGDKDTFATRFIYLQEGFYYPVRISYVNMVYWAEMNLVVTKPDGTNITDFTNVYQFAENKQDSGSCEVVTHTTERSTTTTTKTWSGSYTHYSTTTYSNPSSPVEVIVDIPRTTSTTTTAWTGAATSTTSTTSGKYSESLEVIVEIPKVTTTTTSQWSNSYFSTTTTTAGKYSESVDVIIEKPRTTTTTTTAWTGTKVSTTTKYPSSVSSPVEVIVEVPKTTKTVTEQWSEPYVSTTSTTSGKYSESVEIIIETPRETTTTTTYWDSSILSTSTSFPSESSSPVVVIIEKPKTTFTVTTNWDKQFSSTTTTTEGAYNQTIEVIIETPTTLPIITTTESWSNSVTSTSTKYPAGGNGTITVIIDVPYPTTSSPIYSNTTTSNLLDSLSNSIGSTTLNNLTSFATEYSSQPVVTESSTSSLSSSFNTSSFLSIPPAESTQVSSSTTPITSTPDESSTVTTDIFSSSSALVVTSPLSSSSFSTSSSESSTYLSFGSSFNSSVVSSIPPSASSSLSSSSSSASTSASTSASSASASWSSNTPASLPSQSAIGSSFVSASGTGVTLSATLPDVTVTDVSSLVSTIIQKSSVTETDSTLADVGHETLPITALSAAPSSNVSSVELYSSTTDLFSQSSSASIEAYEGAGSKVFSSASILFGLLAPALIFI